jgi:uncharacterized protein (DUF1330 family)
MPAYVIVENRADDQSKLTLYRRGNTELVARHGGRFIVRGGAVTSLEGGWDPQRVVVIEFPDVAAARGWYDDPDYQPLKADRQAHSETRIILVEGAG